MSLKGFASGVMEAQVDRSVAILKTNSWGGGGPCQIQ